eukprot:GHUV01042734.1.p1 GENE.GHUV01042734.1~~GHUV01042734.1.p1  ORF type:complete len:125 (+),score=11.90 GHUV01042734.1:353-727(+)
MLARVSYAGEHSSTTEISATTVQHPSVTVVHAVRSLNATDSGCKHRRRRNMYTSTPAFKAIEQIPRSFPYCYAIAGLSRCNQDRCSPPPVSTYPGQIALHVMFFCASSSPTVLVNPAIPCLAAL